MQRIFGLLLLFCGGGCTVGCEFSSKSSPSPGGSGSATPVEKTLVGDAGIADAVGTDAPTTSESASAWSVNFSPKGGCTDAVVALIGTAKTSIRVASYTFTSQPVSEALIAAKKTGRDVQVVMDKSNVDASASPTDKATALKSGGVLVFIDSKHSIFHDKFVVVDDKAIETGSFNFTQQAEISNAENCLVFHSSGAAKAYDANWQLHQAHSVAF